jgi:hypothetical protein
MAKKPTSSEIEQAYVTISRVIDIMQEESDENVSSNTDWYLLMGARGVLHKYDMLWTYGKQS